MIGTVKVRIIDVQIAVACADGTSFTGSYRLVTTLTDAHCYPATALVGLYHQRWEHESGYYALRHTIMNGRNLRSRDLAGIEQEMWSLLTLYQALRTVMVDAAESLPGTDPDRCSFSIALHTARNQVIQANGIITPDTDRDALLGTVGIRILAGLLPRRRQRVSTRKVKHVSSGTFPRMKRWKVARPAGAMNRVETRASDGFSDCGIPFSLPITSRADRAMSRGQVVHGSTGALTCNRAPS